MFSAKTSFPICIRLDFLICISLDWCHHSLISFHCLTCSLGTLSWQPLLASWTMRKPGGRMLVAKCSASSTEWKFCESDRCSRIFILWCILSIPSWLPKALKRDIWAVLVVLKNYAFANFISKCYHVPLGGSCLYWLLSNLPDSMSRLKWRRCCSRFLTQCACCCALVESRVLITNMVR